MTTIDKLALALPDVERGVACAGTTLESRTFRVKGKAFLFVSREHVRLKLERSSAEARKHGAEVGAGGWTKLALGAVPAQAILKRWIGESYELLATGAAQKVPAKRKA